MVGICYTVFDITEKLIMKKLIITLIASVGILNAETINLSPSFEKVLEDTARVMSKDGRKDFNKNITYLKKEYKKSGEECDFVVAAYDLHRQSGAGNNTTGFSKYSIRSIGDNDKHDVIFVTEDEVISEDGKTIVFQRSDDEYRSCIYFKTEEKKKKERAERKAKEQESKKKKKKNKNKNKNKRSMEEDGFIELTYRDKLNK